MKLKPFLEELRKFDQGNEEFKVKINIMVREIMSKVALLNLTDKNHDLFISSLETVVGSYIKNITPLHPAQGGWVSTFSYTKNGDDYINESDETQINEKKAAINEHKQALEKYLDETKTDIQNQLEKSKQLEALLEKLSVTPKTGEEKNSPKGPTLFK